MPITRGGTPVHTIEVTRASGVRPYRSTARSDATSSAAAPSLTPEEFPAVMLPPGNSGRSLPSASSEVSRGCSSRSTSTGSPLRDGTATGTISRASRPPATALAVRSCDRSANASWSSRAIPCSSATCWAVCGMESVPCSRSISGLTNRQPSVVSCTSFDARERRRGLGHDERRPRHRLDPARHHQVRVPRPDRPGGLPERVQARPAQPVDRRARHLHRQPCQQRRHARDVAVVLPRLVGAARARRRRARPSPRRRAARPARAARAPPGRPAAPTTAPRRTARSAFGPRPRDTPASPAAPAARPSRAP